MTWAKLDDGFWSNPKVQEVGNEAAGAYARFLSYCGCHLTDGKITDGVARYVTRPAVLKKLHEHRFIERNGDGWMIPDYLEFNPTREQVEEERRCARERMRNVRANRS